MKTTRLLLLSTLTLAITGAAQSRQMSGLTGLPVLHVALMPQGGSGAGSETAAHEQVGVLPAAATEKLLPNAILFKGQLAPVQARNSGAVRHADKTLTIVSLVDSSGYSTSVRERFQFFVYTETPLQLGPNKLLPIGFYGAGFLADNTMVLLDVAGRDIMTVPTMTDSAMARPRPLQVLSRPGSGEIRLYLGRSYVVLGTQP